MSDSSLHSVLAPSSAARNIQCPASTKLELQFPEVGDDLPSLEGTAAHHVLAERFYGRDCPVGSVTPNGQIVTDEMVEGADLAYADVAATLAAAGPPIRSPHFFVEHRVSIGAVHEQCWGTLDIGAITFGPTVYVWDYKFGHGPVEVFENAQLVDYLSGLCDQLGMTEAMNPQLVVRIVQPRAHHPAGVVREWRTTLLGLRPLIDRRRAAAHEALGPNPRMIVGPECLHCRARHACPALEHASLKAMDLAMHAPPLELTPSAMALELRLLERYATMLEARRSGLQEQVLHALRTGKQVAGWMITRSPGRTVWARPAGEVIAVARAMEVDVSKPVEAITPKQAEAAGLDPSIVKAMSRSNPGEAKLTVDDGAFTRHIFGGGR